nr:methyl-accepting chemotaxis protein [Lachnospiraceae bacterium]
MKKRKKVKEAKPTPAISFKDSIKTRLIAIMILVTAVPLFLAVIISYNTSTSKAKADALELLDANANYVAAEF